MNRITRVRAALVLVAAVAGIIAATAAARTDSGAAKPPIVIGAVVDLTKNMAPFDAPALLAAQLQIKAINAKGGVDGRKLKMVFLNDQLDPAQTKQFALQMLQKKVDIGWVTCDVNYAAPAAQEFLNAGKLTIAPCLGTDELSPIRFGSKGKLGFSYGNAAQDEGAAAAEFSYKTKGWRTAVVVTDNLLRYFQDVCKAFTVRFTELGGKIVSQEAFTQGDKTINNVVSKVNNEKSDTIAFCTSFGGDQPAFVSGLRSLHNNTPIINGWASDGSYWWPTNPPVTNFYYLTYASVWGDDPSAQVKAFEAKMKAAGHPAQTGGFLGGAAAIQGIAAAVAKTGGSTNGAKLASVMVKFHKLPTISGNVSFSAGLHTVFGRAYRVIAVNDNKASFVKLVTATSPANIGR
ncbi:MAG: branched-chain amino acid transport system substrate-binding protein [Gaiellaceae bacterium]|jgi:branched-chain amino acid transport system substrate-binding protein|nr:branched-chain amino acid transport system substrate-binding protein [Gaiellaceae bacterium]